MADTDGLHEGAPTPQAAAQELYDILEGLPAFEPCRGPVENWPEELRRKRFPVWDLWPQEWRHNPPAKPKDMWSAYGRGWLVMCDADGRAIRRCRVPADANGQPQPEAVQRVLAARAQEVPDGIRATLRNDWRLAAGIAAGDAAEPEVFVRNDWQERRVLVREVRPGIMKILDTAVRAVRRIGGDERPLTEINNSSTCAASRRYPAATRGA